MEIYINNVQDDVKNFQADPPEDKPLDDEMIYALMVGVELGKALDRALNPTVENGGKYTEEDEL